MCSPYLMCKVVTSLCASSPPDSGAALLPQTHCVCVTHVLVSQSDSPGAARVGGAKGPW